jgi:hypothetical protein
MNLGQMLMVVGAIVLLGILVLNANSTVYQANDTMYTSEFGVTAISLATSLVEESMGKMFDKVVAPINASAVYDSTLLTPPGGLHADAGESYRGLPLGSGLKDFDDFDDFNGFKACYHSDLPSEADATPGFYQITVPGMRAKYYVTCTVTYVKPPNLDAAYTIRQTWHKKITVTVWSPSAINQITNNPDTLVYPAIMSYWN